MALSSDVQRITALGRLPSDAEEFDDLSIRRWVMALDGLEAPLTDEEAAALLDCFPPDDSTVCGVAWTLLHAIESAPYRSELREQLDDRSSWVAYLRERAVRGGLM